LVNRFTHDNSIYGKLFHTFTILLKPAYLSF